MGHGGCLILVAGPMKLAKDPGCMWREGIEPLLFLFLISLLIRDKKEFSPTKCSTISIGK
jgi:hypothetical protein